MSRLDRLGSNQLGAVIGTRDDEVSAEELTGEMFVGFEGHDGAFVFLSLAITPTPQTTLSFDVAITQTGFTGLGCSIVDDGGWTPSGVFTVESGALHVQFSKATADDGDLTSTATMPLLQLLPVGSGTVTIWTNHPSFSFPQSAETAPDSANGTTLVFSL